MGEKVKSECSECSEKTENTEIKILKPYRGAEPFEALRLATERSGKRPKVFLLTYGNLTMRKARAGFATNFFGVAGYEIIDNPGRYNRDFRFWDAYPDKASRNDEPWKGEETA
jgi:methylmalonyl-CoA mutase